MNTTPVLQGQDVRKAFRRANGEMVQALAGVSFSAEPGTLTALVGPDGAGKTTLLRLAAGLMTADAGAIKSSASTLPPIRSRSSRASATCRSGSGCTKI